MRPMYLISLHKADLWAKGVVTASLNVVDIKLTPSA